MSITLTDTSCVTGSVHTFDYPAGMAVGDCVLVTVRGAAFADAPDVSEFSETFVELSQNGTARSEQNTYYRIVDGTEGASVTITISNERKFGISVFHVTEFTGLAADIVVATASGANPPSLAAPSGATNFMWMAGITWQADGVAPSGYPSGYTGTSYLDCLGAYTAWGFKTSDISPEDPGAFTLDGSAPDVYSFTIGFAQADTTRLGFTLTGIKEPNESDTLVTGVSNARVLVWLLNDDTVAADEELTNQTITAGAMEVETPNASTEESVVIATVEWDAGGGETKYFRTTPAIVDLDA